MALLWLEGFEGFGTSLNNAPRPFNIMSTKYPVINREVADFELQAGRITGFCVASGGNTSYFQSPALTTDDTIVIGVAWKIWAPVFNVVMELYSVGDRGIHINYIPVSGQLEVRRANTLLGTTTGLSIPIGRWHYIELKLTTHNSAGSFDLCVAGEIVLSMSGIDTQPGANAYHDRFRVVGAGGVAPQWDDIYFLDSTGSSNNDFLGTVKVACANPDGDDTANWTTSTPSANHYENVNENPCDEDTSYVEESTASVTDLYDYDALPTLGDIYGLQINTVCRETDATTFSLITPIESGGTQYDDLSQIVGTTDWLTVIRLAEEDPDTSTAWTASGVNASKFGVKVG